jgi:hypothetical protein
MDTMLAEMLNRPLQHLSVPKPMPLHHILMTEDEVTLQCYHTLFPFISRNVTHLSILFRNCVNNALLVKGNDSCFIQDSIRITRIWNKNKLEVTTINSIVPTMLLIHAVTFLVSSHRQMKQTPCCNRWRSEQEQARQTHAEVGMCFAYKCIPPWWNSNM